MLKSYHELGVVSLGIIVRLMQHGKMRCEEIFNVLFNLLFDDILQSPLCGRFFDDLEVVLSTVAFGSVKVFLAISSADGTQCCHSSFSNLTPGDQYP